MQSFRSEVFPESFLEKISYSSKSIFIGSCFTEHIGRKMHGLKFPTVLNPFGILYNPASVAQSLRLILNPKLFEEKNLIHYNEKWISFLHHGRFSSTKANEVLNSINSEMTLANQFINDSSILFITLGTAWVYKHKNSGQIVANCHKIPASEFDHFLLSVGDIVEMYRPLFTEINNRNRKLKVVFTVSPVRHWKDGPANNHYSKSILTVAVHELIKQFDFISYFPSYELIIDDLRDYRFYADDLFHPNQLGIDYVWGKFKTCFISPEALELADKIEKILKATLHRPFYPNTQSYLKFLENNLSLISQLESKFHQLDFNQESKHFLNEKEKYFGRLE